MDALMASTQTNPNSLKTWDFEVVNNIVPMLTDSGQPNSVEDLQEATLAAFINYNSIPQLPNIGTPWTGYFTGTVNFADLDSAIRQNIKNVGLTNYVPLYNYVNGQLQVTIARAQS